LAQPDARLVSGVVRTLLHLCRSALDAASIAIKVRKKGLDMGTLLALGLLVVAGVLAIAIGRARPRRRRAAHPVVRTSLDVTSSRSPGELGDVITRGLAGAGVRASGQFDDTRFFRVNAITQLELRVWTEDGRSHAHLTVPSVRSVSGRPQKLAPVGNAVAAAERSVRRDDPSAVIN
jgi:hypothetical protein